MWKNGKSLYDIKSDLGVPKSTAFRWLKGIKNPKTLPFEDRIKIAQKLGVMRLKQLKAERNELYKVDTKKEVDEVYVNRDLEKAVLSMLYWAEGAKTFGVLQFSNTDPNLVKLFLTLLRKNYQIDESRLRVQLHLHYYHPRIKTKEFWSTLLDIPINQFNKIANKPRSVGKRFRKNSWGICGLRYNDREVLARVVNFGYFLGEKMTLAPLAQRIERRPPKS